MTKTTVTLPLKVERNSRFVRGKNKARAEIEGLLACHDDMRRLENRVPGLTIGYDEAGDGRGLDDAVWGLIREIASIAEVRNGVIETDLQEPGTGRSWRPSPTRLSVPLLLGGQALIGVQIRTCTPSNERYGSSSPLRQLPGTSHP